MTQIVAVFREQRVACCVSRQSLAKNGASTAAARVAHTGDSDGDEVDHVWHCAR
jgi:hypothetical protein